MLVMHLLVLPVKIIEN